MSLLGWRAWVSGFGGRDIRLLPRIAETVESARIGPVIEASLAKTETHHGRVIEAKLATSDNPPKGCYQTLMPMNEVGMPARWHQ